MKAELEEKLLEWTRDKNANLLCSLDDIREIAIEGMKVNPCEFDSLDAAALYLREKMKSIYTAADEAIASAVHKTTTERVVNAISFIDKFIGGSKK